MAEINTTQLRDALAWLTNDQPKAEDPGTNPFIWFWEAIQGDFNEERSTGQIVMDAAISMIPLVDQVCDVRDLIANCNKLRQDVKDTWAWVALALTLIGLFPTLGSLVKGVLKIFFAFVRRMGGDATIKAVDMAMTWVITFLRRRDVQKYLKQLRVDEVFKWLAIQIKDLRGKVNIGALLKAFDRGITLLQQLTDKVSLIPSAGAKARACLEQVRKIREVADDYLAKALRPVQDILDTIIMRLERESIAKQHGIVNVNNIHYRGGLPESAAVTLMRNAEPLPEWLSKGSNGKFPPAQYAKLKSSVDDAVKDGWPPLQKHNVESFHDLAAVEIKGPARLYRVLSPNSRAMSDCWVSEAVYREIQSAPNPRAAWRKHLAVWPDWNVNGQFVIYDVKPGETLKVWRGKASSQVKESLENIHLEGGWEQIVFNVARNDTRNDVMRYYELGGSRKDRLQRPLSQEAFYKLPKEKQSSYVGIRESINHPSISGPFDTGWGYSDFGGAGMPDRIGLPTLPGQATTLSGQP
ncbi:hypothetical protein [Pseudoduganella namucuonensis]|uniref:Uncharacterized protein n=1 Tax=Pseudoduganella namucuonensis TaxID=1035707 RepID=A0A1I7JEU5_9BURK|nr:hypothetical protein [Pseudoduganella namucuonensis]SFU83667.1 hypothetical protein SAMN05216552_101167 [Pseudoduganella namucuonensis]